ncbi:MULTISPECIES: hypothetical protein [unclassified Rathayibacter]|uniref:hypothetical protein n=1 Tax=unclassified Rathayibacter TaxID=2609250 RepID=UPI00188D4361|nr:MULTISPECIES: hypothetical protein [unclassified Rathayibacter]MBF4461507.1 hypothetical protein [Rathayibacter sp. VKM Ac-2879]MBF4502918.1 hypothetical protein [Rathayibacter sp. VKM Ac-2878]
MVGVLIGASLFVAVVGLDDLSVSDPGGAVRSWFTTSVGAGRGIRATAVRGDLSED